MSECCRVVAIAVDGSEYSQKAFDWYFEKIRKENDKVAFIYVTEPPSLSFLSLKSGLAPPTEEWSDILQKQLKEVECLKDNYVSFSQAKKLKHDFFHMNNESPGPGIVKRAQLCGAELIIMGTRGQNKVRRTVLGSVSDYVLHHAGIPVAIVPPSACSE